MAKKNPKTCTLTKADDIKVTNHGWLINGELRDNLDDCTFEAGARFTMLIEEVPDPKPQRAPKIEHRESQFNVLHVPAVSDSAPPPQAHASTLELPPELAEVRALMDLYRDAQGFGPYVAIGLVGLALWQKFNKQKGKGCPRCDERERAQHHPPHHDPATCPTCIAQRSHTAQQEAVHTIHPSD